MSDWMLAEFSGTYKTPHPEGFKDQTVLRPFHVFVEMKKDFLKAPGLCAIFQNFYGNAVKEAFPDMVKLNHVDFHGAVELNGDAINNPKAMSHKELLVYIQQKQYPINPSLYTARELRNEVVLYETDPSGQQHLQAKLQQLRGGAIDLANELASRPNLIRKAGEEVVEEKKPGGKKAGKSFAEALA